MQSSRFESLYVHFPFCESRCHYCDFYSIGAERVRPGDTTSFEAALRKEAALWAPSFSSEELKTIFFGGGTPSLTPAESMTRALEPLKIRPRPELEWTMEVNPSSATRPALEAYRALGVNRISMGVQAMRPDLLTRLGRVHDREAVFRALDAVFEAGFQNMSVDLLCGVPGQGVDDLREAIGELTRFPITHLSCYLLTLPPHHRMYADLPGEETQLEHLLLIHEEMTARGFEHYEISNYARPGFQAQHNVLTWKGRSYLGLGPSAHSYEGGQKKRWKNVSSLHRYASLLNEGKSPIDTQEELTPEQLELERWMLSLRLSEGFPAEWLDTPARKARAMEFQSRGWMETHPEAVGRLRLTARGFALSDPIIAALAG